MIDPKKINELVHQVFDSLPDGIKKMPKDIQDNVRAGMHGAFSKLDLVTREEFDAQAAVLQKTRQKLEALEKQIEALEKDRK